MHVPTGLLEPDDNRYSPENESTLCGRVYRADLLSSLTVSIGPVIVRWKFEIARADDVKAVSVDAQQRAVRRSRLQRGLKPQAYPREPGVTRQDQGSGDLRTKPAATYLTGSGLAPPHPGLHPQLDGENCTVVLSDVVAFGAHTRTDADRLIIREALFNMTHAALQGIADGWSWDDRGDGILMVVPPSVPTANVIAQLVKELPCAVERHNSTHHASTRIQLRVAVSVGPVVSDTMGVSGDAIIASARLVDAPVFKEAIAHSTANLGVIASSFVYETAIKHGQDPMGYSQVQVEVKESSMPAWIKLFEDPMPLSYSQVSIRTTSLPGAGS